MSLRASSLVTGFAAVVFAAGAGAAGTWCLGLGALGPIRAGMTTEQALLLADFAGMERKTAVEQCWYLRHPGDAGFELLIIDGRVARIEIPAGSKLSTISGARIGSTEEALRAIYGARLDVQPHKYNENGHTLTYRAANGESGLRFETSSGKVTAIQAGSWEHLHYVERCG
jgi:hypothetical protein